MATDGRQPNAALARREGRGTLAERARQPTAGFNYYRLVQVLLRLRADRGGDPFTPGGLRFRGERSAAFPGREVSHVAVNDADGTVTVTTTNYCVDGVLGPLPAPYTEWLRDQQRQGRHAMAEFLDLFNQQLQILRFRLKAVRTPTLHLGTPEDMAPARAQRALMGLADDAPDAGLPLEDLREFAALWSDRRRSGPVIERVLGHVLGVPVAVGQFVGAWLRPGRADCAHLGRDGVRLGRPREAITARPLGTRAWNPQARVRLTLGPLGWRHLVELLPSGRAHRRLAGAFRLVTDRELDAEIELVARPGTVPPAELRARTAVAGWGLRLGWTAWLHTRADARPRSARFVLPAFAQAPA